MVGLHRPHCGAELLLDLVEFRQELAHRGPRLVDAPSRSQEVQKAANGGDHEAHILVIQRDLSRKETKQEIREVPSSPGCEVGVDVGRPVPEQKDNGANVVRGAAVFGPGLVGPNEIIPLAGLLLAHAGILRREGPGADEARL